MRICCATSGLSSMLSFTMRTAPLAARTAFSRSGPNCLHGPHHGAQKSTMTGCSNEASTTSAMKLAVVTSLIGAAAAPAWPIPPPISVSSGIFASRASSNVIGPSPDLRHRRDRATYPTTWPQDGAMTSAASAGSALALRELDNARGMAAGAEKAYQIIRPDRRRAGVFERMIVERVVRQHRPLQNHRDPTRGVVDRGERRYAARPHAEHLVEQRGRAEREARRAEPVGQRLEIDAAFLERDDEPQPGFLVLEEQALAVPAGQCAAQRLGLLHGENWRKGVGAVRDAERDEPREQRVGGQRTGQHARVRGRPAAAQDLAYRAAPPLLRAPSPDMIWIGPPIGRGRSSGVEHNLAKVGVEGSNPFGRSNHINASRPFPAPRRRSTSRPKTPICCSGRGALFTELQQYLSNLLLI